MHGARSARADAACRAAQPPLRLRRLPVRHRHYDPALGRGGWAVRRACISSFGFSGTGARIGVCRGCGTGTNTGRWRFSHPRLLGGVRACTAIMHHRPDVGPVLRVDP